MFNMMSIVVYDCPKTLSLFSDTLVDEALWQSSTFQYQGLSSAHRQIQTGVQDKHAAVEPPHSIIHWNDVGAVQRPRLRFYELYIMILQKVNSIGSCVWGSALLLQDPVGLVWRHTSRHT